MAFDKELGFDPDSLDSIVQWSRREYLNPRSDYYEAAQRRALERDAAEEKKAAPQQQRQLTNAENTQAWADWVDQRIEQHITSALEEFTKFIANETYRAVHIDLDTMRQELQREILQKVEQRPKVIIHDPSEALEKQIMKFAGGLREELTEIRKDLGLQRKGEIVDLPMLRKRRA